MVRARQSAADGRGDYHTFSLNCTKYVFKMLVSECGNINDTSHHQPEQSGTHDLNSFSVGATPIEVLYKLLSRDKANGTH